LISGLSATNAYNVRVAAYNSVGYGAFQSAATSYRPAVNVPWPPASVDIIGRPGNPFGVVPASAVPLASLSATSLVVYWEEPQSYGNSAILPSNPTVMSYIVAWDHTQSFRSQCGDNAETQYLSLTATPPLTMTDKIQISIGSTVVGCIEWGISASDLETRFRAVTGYEETVVTKHGDDSPAWNDGHMYEIVFYTALNVPPLGNVPSIVAQTVAGTCDSFTGTATVTNAAYGPGLDAIEGVGVDHPTLNACDAQYLRPQGKITVTDAAAKSTALGLKLPPGSNLKPVCMSCAQSMIGTTVGVTVNLISTLAVGNQFSIGTEKCIYTVQAITGSSITVNAAPNDCPTFIGQARPIWYYSVRAYIVQDVEPGTPFYARVSADNGVGQSPPNYSY
jgi:hypothetical protein